MPHDMNGNVLKAGDKVLVPMIVEEVYENEEACNVRLRTELPMYPVVDEKPWHPELSAINASQVMLDNDRNLRWINDGGWRQIH